MPDRPRLWRRLCADCLMLDQSYAALAAEADGEAALSEPWACPSCGGANALATRPLADDDLAERPSS